MLTICPEREVGSGSMSNPKLIAEKIRMFFYDDDLDLWIKRKKKYITWERQWLHNKKWRRYHKRPKILKKDLKGNLIELCEKYNFSPKTTQAMVLDGILLDKRMNELKR